MRILQMVPYFPPARFGGVLSQAHNLSRGLADDGHDVVVYTTDTYDRTSRLPKKLPSWPRNLKVRYFRNISNTLAASYRLCTPLGMVPELRREVDTFDVVHIHDFRGTLALLGGLGARGSKVPYLLQAHGSMKTGSTFRSIYDRTVGSRLVKGAASLIALSDTEANQYAALGANRSAIAHIPNGIDLRLFSDLPRRGLFREKHGLGDKQLVLFVGRVNRIKGPDFLVAAFADLVREMPDARLAIVGPDDGYLAPLTALARKLGVLDKVVVTGFLQGADKLSAYVDADLLVCPSRQEEFPLVPFESLLCGTPVIVTRNTGIGRLIGESGAGQLVDFGDLQGLKVLMRAGLEHKESVEGTVIRGQEFIRNNLSSRKVLSLTVALYEQVASARADR